MEIVKSKHHLNRFHHIHKLFFMGWGFVQCFFQYLSSRLRKRVLSRVGAPKKVDDGRALASRTFERVNVIGKNNVRNEYDENYRLSVIEYGILLSFFYAVIEWARMVELSSKDFSSVTSNRKQILCHNSTLLPTIHSISLAFEDYKNHSCLYLIVAHCYKKAVYKQAQQLILQSVK